ncbi:hypothetical protein STCU_03644 [Strigomonas culicis]|uniref:Uncharacterized protein n=1 Tax=Strigomonas culicis TaxID=28005 RepID=S9UQ27_9TRYP|nr:hypothetical protein STCU_03809 [Strigomonas culicis]EPY31059.1 hypothetical protein STCU_03644 [Strigomonas culicis]|eukprot:EPY30894.1 hypothetical protein STCU_03809 [Strigomonas culicis]
MVSKTRKQRQKKKELLREHGGTLPPVVPQQPKSIHLKKTRPRMKGKKKIRLGLECPVDIYEGFDEKEGVVWHCPKCSRQCRTIGFCVACATGKTFKQHTGLTMSRKAARSTPVASTATAAKKAAVKKLKAKRKT